MSSWSAFLAPADQMARVAPRDAILSFDPHLDVTTVCLGPLVATSKGASFVPFVFMNAEGRPLRLSDRFHAWFALPSLLGDRHTDVVLLLESNRWTELTISDAWLFHDRVGVDLDAVCDWACFGSGVPLHGEQHSIEDMLVFPGRFPIVEDSQPTLAPVTLNYDNAETRERLMLAARQHAWLKKKVVKDLAERIPSWPADVAANAAWVLGHKGTTKLAIQHLDNEFASGRLEPGAGIPLAELLRAKALAKRFAKAAKARS